MPGDARGGGWVTERQFQNWMMDVARRLGWRVWHVPSPMRHVPDGRGFVGAREAAGLADLILIGRTRVLFIEVKGRRGKLSSKQTEFLEAANRVRSDAVAAYCFRPGDEEAVEALLQGC